MALPVRLIAYAAVAEGKGQLEFAFILEETAVILRERRASIRMTKGSAERYAEGA